MKKTKLNTPKRALMLFIFILAGTITGCWDKVELENRGFVNALAIDKAEESETRFAVTMALPSKEMLVSKGSAENGREIKHQKGRTLAAAMHLVDVSSSQNQYYGHAKAAVFGEGLMADADLFKETLDALTQNPEISRKLIIVAAEGEAGAKAILEAETPGEPLFGLFMQNFYKDSRERAGRAFRLDLQTLIRQMRTSGAALIPKVTVTDNELKLSGAAVIKDFKLTGFLDEKQGRGYLWATGRADGAILEAAFEGRLVPLRIIRTRANTTFQEENGQIHCRIDVHARGSIDGYAFGKKTFENRANITTLEQACANLIADEIVALTHHLQHNVQADALQLKEQLRKHNPHLYTQHADNWDTIFQHMHIFPDVRVILEGR